MQDLWSTLEKSYNREQLWGPRGAQMILWQNVLRCHGEIPIGAAFLALAAGCSNGALTKLWGEHPRLSRCGFSI